MLDAEGNNARRAIPFHNTRFNRTIGEIECANSRPRRGYSVKGVDHNGSGHGRCETLKRRKDETSTRLAALIKAHFLRTSEWFKATQARQFVLEVMPVGNADVSRHADAQAWGPIIARADGALSGGGLHCAWTASDPALQRVIQRLSTLGCTSSLPVLLTLTLVQ
jgi:hypothetical protein